VSLDELLHHWKEHEHDERGTSTTEAACAPTWTKAPPSSRII
jgi:hypothetical protein